MFGILPWFSACQKPVQLLTPQRLPRKLGRFSISHLQSRIIGIAIVPLQSPYIHEVMTIGPQLRNLQVNSNDVYLYTFNEPIREPEAGPERPEMRSPIWPTFLISLRLGGFWLRVLGFGVRSSRVSFRDWSFRLQGFRASGFKCLAPRLPVLGCKLKGIAHSGRKS